MPFRKEQSSVRSGRKSLNYLGLCVLLLLFFGACNFMAGVPTAAAEPDMTVWRKIESPLFPADWPPTADSVWVRYTFAYGSNPAKLVDAVSVTEPLSKTEWKGGVSTTTVLSTDMKQAAVQGTFPLEEEIQGILDTEKQVSGYSLKLSALPDPNMSETKEMLAYYQAWFKNNNAFLGLIRENHTDFINWVTSGK